jgi:hypothetical protein
MQRTTTVLGALTLLASVAGCAYAPSFEDNQLHCGLNSTCPKAYSCHRDTNTCFKTQPVDNLVGHWVFGGSSSQTVTCSDSPTPVKKKLMGPDDYVEVTRVSETAVTGDYYCPWNLNLSADKSHTVLPASPVQSCSRAGTDGTMFTWHGNTFTFSSSDGTSARLDARIGIDFVDTKGVTGTCTLDVAGTLTNS